LCPDPDSTITTAHSTRFLLPKSALRPALAPSSRMARGPESMHLRSWRPSKSNRLITGSDRVLAAPQGTLRFQVQGHTITSSLRVMRGSANQLASRQPVMKPSGNMREPLLAQANISLTSTSALGHLRERNLGLSSVTGRRRSDHLAQELTIRLIVS